MLATKGYEVVDLRRIALGWNKPISEMTVDEILGRSRGTVDAVFIFHYSDRGDVLGYVAERKTSSTGFSALGYSGAMFDVATKERILSFRPKLFRTENITQVIAADPEVRADPLQSGKVLKTERVWDAAISMSDEEVVEHVAKYICHGVKWGWNEWTGLDAIVP
jgi:hypothetical protein